MSANFDFDVAIVGGGAAGIAAARRLASCELSTVLVEAGPRLGGRAWTRGVEGLPLDMGCGWLHSADRNAWVPVAEGANVRIDRSAAKWGVQYRDLGFPPAEQAAARAAYAAWSNRLAEFDESDCAADALLPGDEWNDYIRIIAGFISGGPLERLSIADYRAYDDASTECNWRVPSGYGALIVGSVPQSSTVHLSTPVDEIALAGRGVTLRTPAGALRARAAIVTVSTSVLAGDTLALPAELIPWREAAAALPLGRNEKIFFGIVGEPAFAPDSQVLGDPRDARSASYYLRPFGMPVVEGFFGGDGARLVEEGGDAAGFEFALTQLGALFGAEIRKRLRPLAASAWSGAARIGGAYSYALPGRASARALLARPFDDRVFFAGEATSVGDFSTAHGAHDSGVRAAEEAVAALRGSSTR